MDHFLYAGWTLVFLAIWLALYLFRKDTRTEMLWISAFFGLGGVSSEKVYVQDWWHPLTITGTAIGFEDFFIGFAIGGVAAVLYTELYHRRLKKNLRKTKNPLDPGFFLLLFPLAFLTMFFLLRVNSFYATVIPLVACIAYMLFIRRDLVADSFWSGVCLMVLGAAMYLALLQLDQRFISDYWYLPHTWYAQEFWGIPLGEYIWYFLVGAYIGPLYEYLKKLKLAPMRPKQA